jgi:hypothetical protein
MKKHYSLFVLILSIIYSCAPTRYVKPLEKGEHAINTHLGGPITKVPGIGSIPLPYTSIGYGYGLKENTTIFANLYTTSLLFGVSQIDIGATYQPWKADRMGLTLQPNLNILIDLYTGANRFWPQLDANYYYDYLIYKSKALEGHNPKRMNSIYTGLSNWFDPYPTESQGRKNEQFWMPSIQLGHLWERIHWDFQLELKVLAPIYSNKNIVVDYPSLLGSFGALGGYFGIHYKF